MFRSASTTISTQCFTLFCFVLNSYGGIYECGSREYTLDDFYSLQLDKMERYVCLKESGVVISEGDGESSSSDDDDDDEKDDEDEEDGTDGDEDGKENAEKSEEEEDAIKPQTDTKKVLFLCFSHYHSYPSFFHGRLTSVSKPQHSWVSRRMLHDRLKM